MRRRWFWLCAVVGLSAVGCGPTSCSMVDWSPDGKKVVTVWPAGHDDSALAIVDVQTGARQVLPNSKNGAGPCWSPDGRWIAFGQTVSGDSKEDQSFIRLYNVATKKIEASLDAGVGPLSWSPDGRYLLTCRQTGDSESDLVWYSLADREVTRTVPLPKGDPWPFNSGLAWLPGGEDLIIGIGNDLWLVRSDSPSQLTHTGDVIGFCVPADGRGVLVARKAKPGSLMTLQKIDLRTRAVARLPVPPGGPDGTRNQAMYVCFAPTGAYAAVVGGSRKNEEMEWLCVLAMDGSGSRTVWEARHPTKDGGPFVMPSYSRDGRRLAAFVATNDSGSLFICRADGTGKRALLGAR